MATARKRQKVRDAAEFSPETLRRALTPPRSSLGAYAWTPTAIMGARDDQLRGHFWLPAQLADSMRTDDALFVAYENRLAPQRCIGVEIKAAPGRRGEAVAKEAEGQFGADGAALSPETLGDVNGCLANHGLAVCAIGWTARDDGARADPLVRYWPIEHVRWDDVKRSLVTRVEGPDGLALPEEPIVHGDGRWIVFAKHEHRPWSQEACILPAALVWARHAYASRDWVKGSGAHGNAKVVGELPEGVALQGSDGGLSAEGAALLQLVAGIADTESVYGIRPSGAKIDYLTNTSRAWEVWDKLIVNAERAAARIYLGTDGTMGSQGGAPGVDIAALFGVATTKIQGDLQCIERALLTGLLEPWTAINFGDSSLCPSRVYMMPDADADAERAGRATRSAAFFADVQAHRDGGFLVDQEVVDRLAKHHGVPAPRLAPPAAPAQAAGPPDLRVVEPPREDVRAEQEHAARMLGALVSDLDTLRSLGRDPSDAYVTALSKRLGVPPPLKTAGGSP